jgi:Xaa-Pro aminopeptidase
MPHSLGHGIGLLVHEQPRLTLYSKDILKTGMVFSVEPGIYLPNYAGVRIEDLLVITDTGIETLTKAPKNLIELS